jgi:hypothetical protein
MLACVSLGLPACAASSYAGIPLAAGSADPELQQLARRARAGDGRAQLELGIRYEEGRGVPPDRRRAEQLYRIAATGDGGRIHVYSPPVGKNDSGRVLSVPTGPARSGSGEARLRLQRLRGGEVSQPASTPEASSADANKRLASLWNDSIALLSSDDKAHIDAGLRALQNRSDSQIRFQRQVVKCPAPAGGIVFPVATAACEKGVGQALVVQVWDEELSPAGARRIDTARPGCMTIVDAYSMLARWRPRPFFHRSPVTLPSERNSGISVDQTVTPEIVYLSSSGNMIYMYYYSRSNCLSNFYLIMPDHLNSYREFPPERR